MTNEVPEQAGWWKSPKPEDPPTNEGTLIPEAPVSEVSVPETLAPTVPAQGSPTPAVPASGPIESAENVAHRSGVYQPGVSRREVMHDGTNVRASSPWAPQSSSWARPAVGVGPAVAAAAGEGTPKPVSAYAPPASGTEPQAAHTASTSAVPPAVQAKPFSTSQFQAAKTPSSTTYGTAGGSYAGAGANTPHIAQGTGGGGSGYGGPRGVTYASSPSPYPPKKKPGWTALLVGLVVMGIASSAATLGIAGMHGDLWESGSSNSRTDVPGAGLQSGAEVVPPVTAEVSAPNWEAVARAVRPATVSINVDSAYGSGTGSGVIIDGEGHIITNHHVVETALNEGTVTVSLHDGRIYNASIVGTDSTTDLAVLKFNNLPDNLVAARLGSSEDLEVGQPVMAIGSPLGLADTVTTGVISALDRPVTVETSSGTDPMNPAGQTQPELVITNAIQIDASINPGNSGGPLFDAEGGVVGINSSIASTSSSSAEAGSIGLGFAIPVDLAKSIAEQIITNGSVEHALLGVEITTGVAEKDSVSYLGAQVVNVVAGGAADEAGLQAGDVIIAIDGNAVTSGPALTGFVRRYLSGDTVTLEVLRNGEPLQVEATLQTRS